MLQFILGLAVLCIAAAGTGAAPDPEGAPPRPIPCQRTRQCLLELGIHSDCVKRLCVCSDEAVYVAGEMPTCFKTQPVIGGRCESAKECQVEASQCRRHICECADGLVASLDNSSCLDGGRLVGESCELDEQCKDSTGEVICITNALTSKGMKTCSCKQGFIQHNVQCYKKQFIGDSCENEINCGHIRNAMCNTNCSCVNGYVTNANNSECLRVVTNYRSSCVEDVQCSEGLGDNVVCIDSSCECKTGLAYDSDGRKCIAMKDATKVNVESAVEEEEEEEEREGRGAGKTPEVVDATPQIEPNVAQIGNLAPVQTRTSGVLGTLFVILLLI